MRPRLLTSLLAAALFGGCSPSTEDGAALIFRGGTVRTLHPSRPVVQALAVDSQGRIAALGDAQELERLAGTSTHFVELGGGTLLAGFKDHHVHLLNVGLSLLNAAEDQRLYLDLSDAPSLEEIAQRVRQRAESLPAGSWILGKGWSQSAWGSHQLPSHRPLTEAAPQHPVFLTRVDGHAGWANAAALQAAGIDASTPDPPGGAILRDHAGNPSGTLLERANEAVTRLIPRPSAQDVRSAFRLAAEALAAGGVTEVYEAGFLTPPGIVDLGADLKFYLEQLQSEDASSPLPLRIHLMIPAPSRLAEAVLANAERYRNLSPRLGVTHLKLFADGAMGSRGADLSHPFQDDPSTRGVPRMSADEIRTLAGRALQAGLDVATHAIGDAAVGRTLDVYEQLLRDNPRLQPTRLRIEHFSYSSQADMERAAQLGVVLSVQPAFVIPGPDGQTMEDLRVGPQNSSRVYAWGSLLKLEAALAGGSDDFTQPGPALLHFYSALTRSNRQGQPPGGWQPDQKLSRLESLQLFTRIYPPAGVSPRPGLRVLGPADLALLSADPMTAPEPEILNIQVRATWLGGQQTFGEVQGPKSNVQGRTDGTHR